jgi:hypothetical protein
MCLLWWFSMGTAAASQPFLAVAPMVSFLSSADVPCSGSIFEAAGGWFGEVKWMRTQVCPDRLAAMRGGCGGGVLTCCVVAVGRVLQHQRLGDEAVHR